MRREFLLFCFFAVIVFLVNSKSLGLTLYADDWLVISKYYAIFGPDRIFPFWRIDTWFADYGFQNITPILFSVFRFNHWLYFVTNLLIKTLASFSLYLFAKKCVGRRVGILAGIFYSASAVGIETTDWVYNMSSYLGLFIVLTGLTYFMKEGLKDKVVGWLLSIFGYTVGSIRLFVIPPLIVVLDFFRGLLRNKKISFWVFARSVISVIVLLGLILVYRKLFPLLGDSRSAIYYVGTGVSTAAKMIAEGRFDFLAYPLVSVGQMIFPFGLKELGTYGFQIYPMVNFIIIGSLLALLATFFYVLAFLKNVNFKKILYLFVISCVILATLKLFVRYQGQWALRDFHVFAAAYFGAIFLAITIAKMSISLYRRDFKQFVFYSVSLSATLSFLFPQLVNPTIIFPTIHRYLAFGSVGIALVLAQTLKSRKSDGIGLSYLKYFLIITFLVLNIIEADRFYSYQLTGRNPKLESKIFSQIRVLVPDYPQDEPVVFYFEYPYHKTYYDLLLSSFGYHMQILYNKPFDEKNIPSTADTYERLVQEVKTRRAPSNHVYALFWVDGKFVDKSAEVRHKLDHDIGLSKN